jgi:uncharacterized OB-fold protein
MSVLASTVPVAEGLFSTEPPALLAGRCTACGALHFPRRGMCPECQATTVAEAALSTRGRLFTFTIVRMSPPGYLGETPYAIGIVELPEGLRVASTIVADDLEALAIDDEVHFELLTLGEGDDAVLSFAHRREARS